MSKEKECCDFKVTKTEDGFRLDVKGLEVEKIMKYCMTNCCCGKKGE